METIERNQPEAEGNHSDMYDFYTYHIPKTGLMNGGNMWL